MAIEIESVVTRSSVRERKLQLGLEAVNPQKAEDWFLRLTSYLDNEGQGRWRMEERENSSVLICGDHLENFRIAFKPNETHAGGGLLAYCGGKIEEILLLGKPSSERMLIFLLDNQFNFKIYCPEGKIRLLIYRREPNGLKNHAS